MRISLVIAALVAVPLSIGSASTGEEGMQEGNNGAITQSPGKPLHPVQVRALVDGPITAGVESGAVLVIESSRAIDNIEVTLQPKWGTELSATRFERTVAASSGDRPLSFGFRFRPVSDAPQPVNVLVRATDSEGRVLTREVTLSLAGKGAAPPASKKLRAIEVHDVPVPEGDVVVPAQQEIRRGN